MPATHSSSTPPVSKDVIRPVEEMPGCFSANIAVNGSYVHCVYGGDGPAVVLIHGFPQDWTEYREIMPRLCKRFKVVAVDLPGLGLWARRRAVTKRRTSRTRYTLLPIL